MLDTRLTLASFVQFPTNLYNFVDMFLAKCFEDYDSLPLVDVSNHEHGLGTCNGMPLLRTDSQAQ